MSEGHYIHKGSRRPISPKKPLISLQTSNRFADSDEGFAGTGTRYEEAAKHGRECVRVWNETIPDDLKPYCELALEIRTHDHENRYECFRRGFEEMEKAGVPANLQVSDPHDKFIFDPVYAEKLVEEFSCIETLTITEQRFEHYSTFNVPRYAIPPNTRHAMDVVEIAARHDKNVFISLQDTKLLHLGADAVNQPFMELLHANHERIVPINEHIGPRIFTRHGANSGFWLAEVADNWGVEPQSWWFENARMIEPGIFGQGQWDNTRNMPPDMYRAMILIGASLGATVFDFEPFWDLFDYDNSECWEKHIVPTFREIIARDLIPTKEQVKDKMKVAYQYDVARDIREFHKMLKDIDWIGDEGLLLRAAYGLWGRYMQHELIPNKSRYYFIPFLPPTTPQHVLDEFDAVLHVGQCDTEEGYQQILDRHYPEPEESGEAWICTINGNTYVMQTHENLYEKQRYSVELPKSVTGLKAERTDIGVKLTWDHDPGASTYYVQRVEGDALPVKLGFSKTIWHPTPAPMDDPELRHTLYHENRPKKDLHFPDMHPLPALARTEKAEYVDSMVDDSQTYTYTVTAETSTRYRREGTVNYLDYLVFSQTISEPGEQLTVTPDSVGAARPVTDPEDTRPESQHWYPTFDGAEGDDKVIAEQIVQRIEEFKAAYESADRRRMADLYSTRYQDPNGWHREYVDRAWKFWFFRNNDFILLRQIRNWDFSEYDETGRVSVHMFTLFRSVRWDDSPTGYGWDGTVRLPRHPSEEVTYTWIQEEDQKWRLITTNPAMPNMQEMVWNSRGIDNQSKLEPTLDD